MLCHRRLSSGPPLSVITAILILVIFITKQGKDMYERNQKQHRMVNYNAFLNEVSSSMKLLEASTNKSSDSLHRLMDVLQRQHKQKPVSTSS